MRSHSKFFSSFSCWVIWYLRRTCPSSVSCVPFWLFLLSYLNPFLTVLHASGIPSLLAVSEDPNSVFFFNLLTWASFLFLSSFLINFQACPFFLLYVFGLTISSLFPWPFVLISLGLDAVTFWTSTGFLWVVVAKAALFKGLLHINVTRKVAAMHLMRWQQLFLRYFLGFPSFSYVHEARPYHWSFLEGHFNC